MNDKTEIQESCLVFPFSRVNANAISALLASLDIHSTLSRFPTYLPNLKDDIAVVTSEITGFSKIILAISAYSTQFEEVCDYIKNFMNENSSKELLIFVGGPHAIGDPLSLLSKGADVVCTGEGEWVFSRIISAFISDSQWKEIPGIAFLNQGKLVRNSKAPLVELDDYPPFSVERALIRPIEITRGCAWKCRFCQIRSKGSPVRHRSIPKILRYIKYTKEYFSERRPDIRFISPNALSYGSEDGKTVNLEIIEALLSQIRELIGDHGKIYFGSFPSEVRPETITVESARVLKKYTNVDKIVIGGQSGSDFVLDKSDRGHTVDETERAVKILLNWGFKVDVDIIFGLPGEDNEAVMLTKQHISRLTEMGATIHSHAFMPLVGTPFASNAPGIIDKGYIELIINLQQERKLSGFHSKQSKEAQKMAQRRATFKLSKGS